MGASNGCHSRRGCAVTQHTHPHPLSSSAVRLQAGKRDKGEEEWVRISSVPMASLDTIKTWLDDVADLVRAVPRRDVTRVGGSSLSRAARRPTRAYIN